MSRTVTIVVVGLLLLGALLYLNRDLVLTESILLKLPKIANLSLKIGADSRIIYRDEFPLLVLLLQEPHPNNFVLARILLEHAAPVNAQWSKNGETPLFSALDVGNERVIEQPRLAMIKVTPGARVVPT